MEHALAFDLSGCVNSAPVSVVGHGLVHANRVELDFADGAGSVRWDRVLGPLAVLDPLLLACTGVAPPSTDGLPSFFDADAALTDEARREVGRANLTGLIQRENDLIRVQAQFLEARYQLEPLERVTRVVAPYPISVLPSAPGRMVTTSAWTVETTRGAVFTGTVLTRHALGGDVPTVPSLLQVDSFAIERGPGDGDFRVVVTAAWDARER